MGDKIKTSISVDKKLWERFRSRIGDERGLKKLSQAVEEALEEELSEDLIIEVLERLLGPEKLPLTITPVEPKARTNAGKTVRELRERML